ncbi:Legumaturain, partial [Operophtera brumata]
MDIKLYPYGLAECGKLMQIDAEPIKACASGSKGSELLRYYGEETNKAWVFAVPYITVNGVQVSQKNFQRDVCEALPKE